MPAPVTRVKLTRTTCTAGAQNPGNPLRSSVPLPFAAAPLTCSVALLLRERYPIHGPYRAVGAAAATPTVFRQRQGAQVVCLRFVRTANAAAGPCNISP